MAVLLLKVIEVLGCDFGFLLERSSRVFQSMWLFVLWSQSSSRCSCQSSVLCSWISLSISVLRVGSDGSAWFCCLVAFLCVMRSLMFWGSSLCLLCCFPLGMWCLSALRMMFVIIVLAW